jgi:hypothetical protein
MIMAAFQTLVAVVTLLGTSVDVTPGLVSLAGMRSASGFFQNRSTSGAT